MERALSLAGDGPVAVVSPDPGGVKRAQLFREMLERKLGRPVAHGFLDKRRSAGVVSGDLFAGDVKDATVLVIDDLIASGGTIARAAVRCLEEGARTVYAFAAHGLFTGAAQETLGGARLAKIVVTDSVPGERLSAETRQKHVEVISCAPLLAQAIRVLHEGGSIKALLGEED
jgi:ribose-phosphate pyrophosphokinase